MPDPETIQHCVNSIFKDRSYRQDKDSDLEVLLRGVECNPINPISVYFAKLILSIL